MNKAIVWGLVLLCFLAAQSAVAEPLKVFVSILPQKDFVEKIGGDLVDVSVMVQPGASPATYEPKPRQMVALAKTKIYFTIGVPFEAIWLEKIAATNSDMLIVHTEAGIMRLPMRTPFPHPEDRHHQKDREKDLQTEEDHKREEVHGGINDPHVWLSPPLVMQLARNIFVALVALTPTHQSEYEANYRKFILEIVELDLELKRVFAKVGEHATFMVFHPSWGYFARAYGLAQVPVEIEGKEPKPAELKDLIQYAKSRGIKVVFAQPQFSWQAVQTIAHSIGGKVISVDPLALDWTNNLREVASKFKEALR